MVSQVPQVEGKSSAPLKDPIEECLLWILENFDKPMSAAALRARVARMPGIWIFDEALEAIDSFGIRAKEFSGSVNDLLVLEQVVFFETHLGDPAILIPKREDQPSQLYLPHTDNRPQNLECEKLTEIFTGRAYVLEKPSSIAEGDSKSHRGRYGHWFFGPLFASRHIYYQVALAAFMTNLFAFASSGFSMIVYDRVVPNNAIDTLIALVVGVFLIFIADFVIRSLRSYFLDIAGAQADMIIADTLFEQLVDMQLDSRKSSVGGLSNSLREFETLRDFTTSTTLTTFIDIPFALMFLVIIYAIGGSLVWVPVVAIILVVATSLIVHPRLKKLSETNFEDNQTKQTVAVETLQGIETVKAIGIGSIMRKRWQDVVAHQSAIGLKTRMLAQLAGNISNFANQFVWVMTVTVGVLLVQTGQVGTGAIVACSMLAGRCIAPLAQLTQLLTRMNQAIASYRSLSNIMQQPREHKENAAYLNRSDWLGSIEFRDVSFKYPDQNHGCLQNVSFKIEPGEKIALVGKVGSGKTTVAKLILGLHQPDSGSILVDGIDIRQIDPADLRRNIGTVMQDVWLMTGTVKHNIAVGMHNPKDEDILDAAQISGVHDFMATHPEGYGFRLRERGAGLSGGQRQAIAIARAIIGRPPILLMDEPSSAMDVNSEKLLIEKLKQHLIKQTIVVVTHRASIIELVDKVIVIEGGKIAAQGPKSEFMKSNNAKVKQVVNQKDLESGSPGGVHGSGPSGPKDSSSKSVSDAAPSSNVGVASGGIPGLVIKPASKKGKDS